MTGFETFIYVLGSLTFAIACTAAAMWLIDRIEHPRGCRR
jgi:hypothetical protein